MGLTALPPSGENQVGQSPQLGRLQTAIIDKLLNLPKNARGSLPLGSSEDLPDGVEAGSQSIEPSVPGSLFLIFVQKRRSIQTAAIR
jgi:hypothetical protein